LTLGYHGRVTLFQKNIIMKTIAVHSHSELTSLVSQKERTHLLIYKGGAEQSECAYARIVGLDAEDEVLIADVSQVRDIHGNLGVDSAPSLVVFREGVVANIVKGCQTEASYESILSGKGIGAFASSEKGAKVNRVTVYTTPTCTWCTTLKTYLDQQGVRYQEVNVAADTSAAEAMVRKSGQQGVPQTEINGQMIVGFDKPRINQLLEIQ
jgi:glutaredoxin-like YruB-family protein